MRDYPKAGGSSQKVSQASVDYRGATIPNEQCGRCDMFRRPHACTAVEGRIAAEMVCDIFEPQH